MSPPPIALVVEDDELQREILCDFLKDEHMDVIQCESAEAAELIIARVGAELSLLVRISGSPAKAPESTLPVSPRSDFRIFG